MLEPCLQSVTVSILHVTLMGAVLNSEVPACYTDG